MRTTRVLILFTSIVFWSGLGTLLGFSTAFAGTPLPPPFEMGSFVAPDRTTLGQENSIRGDVEAYYKRRQRCQSDALPRLRHGYAESSAQAIAKAQAKWTACDAKALAKFQDDVADDFDHGVPGCIDQALVDLLKSLIDGLLGVQAPVVFCDTDGAAPDPIVGINVPDKEREADGEAGVAVLVTRAALGNDKCLATAAGNILKHGAPDDKFNDCLAKAASVTTSITFRTLVNGHKLPPCLTPASTTSIADAARQLGTIITSLTYCASPSGAFVDGQPVY